MRQGARIMISGIAGFAGSTLAKCLANAGAEVFGIDSFVRPGSETNRSTLKQEGIKVVHGDVRCQSDLESLPSAEWVVDASANPSVLAGLEAGSGSRKVVEHNLLGTVNLLEYCRRVGAGFILLSTSRVYSIAPLSALPVTVREDAFVPELQTNNLPDGLGPNGVSEHFPATPPISLYGATKLASETLALEYGHAFEFPVWINRCGVLAGAGQFGRPDQGIVSFWLNSWHRSKPLKYIGYGGTGHQVRDCLHPADLATLIEQQMNEPAETNKPRVINVSGGTAGSFSLAHLSDWCRRRWGDRPVDRVADQRAFDIPWMVLDSGLAHQVWQWQPSRTLESILEEVAIHAEAHSDWLDLSAESI